MRATTIAIVGLLAIAVVTVPPAVETLTGVETPSAVVEAQAVVCNEELPGGCCNTPVHHLFNIQC